MNFDPRDSGPFMPKCRVIDPAFTWGRERAPSVPWDRTIVYETHVRGYTMMHPAVPETMRGTYAGLGRKEVVDYIRSLGVTSVELLPIHAFVKDSHLLDKGLTNYWGYNTPNPCQFVDARGQDMMTIPEEGHTGHTELFFRGRLCIFAPEGDQKSVSPISVAVTM